MLLTGRRAGSTRLSFRAEAAPGAFQLTDDRAISAGSACPDPRDARRIYLLRGPRVLCLDPETFATREMGEIPGPNVGGFMSPTVSHDGQWLATGKQRDAANWEIEQWTPPPGKYRTVVARGSGSGTCNTVRRIR